eukprot:1157615-Pelagomonas_calceolata.AAC.3
MQRIWAYPACHNHCWHCLEQSGSSGACGIPCINPDWGPQLQGISWTNEQEAVQHFPGWKHAVPPCPCQRRRM